MKTRSYGQGRTAGVGFETGHSPRWAATRKFDLNANPLRRGLNHIGGLTPFFSAVTLALVRLPSGPLRAITNTAAPSFSKLGSPGA
jgi:hypothetical protein